ncbi:MAG: T9SS type A sorting domain-containing protein [Bacteroidia bacterium]
MKKIITIASLALTICLNAKAQHTGLNYYGGAYHFDTLHVDTGGYVRNNSGCEIHFAGFNEGAMSTGGADGIDTVHVANLKSLFPCNIIRMEINSRWWVLNDTVPVHGKRFKAAFIENIARAKRLGFYVLIDFFVNYSNLPWSTPGYGSQTLGESNFATNHDTTELQQSNFYALQAIRDLAQLYGNDPAILFDLWNEPAGYIWAPTVPNSANESKFLPRMNQRIDTLRKYAPNSIAVIYCERVDSMQADPTRFPFYTQSNILIDYHQYDTASCYCGPANINFLRSHGTSRITCEWGSTQTWPVDSAYTSHLLGFGKREHEGMLIYHDTHLFVTSPLGLTKSGHWVASGYDSLFISDTTTCLNSTGISQLRIQNDEVSIYPNPASQLVNLSIGQFDNASIEIYNTIGECVHRQIITSSNSQIDISNLQSGLYMVKILTNQGTSIKKFVKE